MASKMITSLVRIMFLGIFFVFLFYPDKFQVKFDYPGFPQSDSWYIRLAKLSFWLLLVIEVLRIFYYGIVKSKANKLISNIATIVVPIFVTLVFLEIIFMYIPQSHEGVLSKASQIWWEKYWKPVNSLGYHDKEVTQEPGKKHVLVVGDSFAAGHGLKNVDDRFSNILEAELGKDKYTVYNLGMSGADTRDEAKRLLEFPVKPDIIILEYFPNDVDKVGIEKGLSLSASETYADIKSPITTLVSRFYLPNFIYWQLPHTGFSTFENFVQKAYSDTTILNAHLRDLSTITNYKDSTGAKMYAVFVPFLSQMEKSAGYTKPVEDFLKSKGVTVVPLNDGINRIPVKERVVGKNDGHASAAVNKLIADRLLEAMKKD